jgi:hypothetical protein
MFGCHYLSVPYIIDTDVACVFVNQASFYVSFFITFIAIQMSVWLDALRRFHSSAKCVSASRPQWSGPTGAQPSAGRDVATPCRGMRAVGNVYSMRGTLDGHTAAGAAFCVFLVHSSSWESNSSSASQEIPYHVDNPKVHYRVHNSPPFSPILSEMNPVYVIGSCYFNIDSNPLKTKRICFI